MIENAEDLEFALGWIPEAKMRAPRQRTLPGSPGKNKGWWTG